jgi:fructose-bisphosphate aldolase class II
MLVTSKEVLADARALGYAVPGFDCVEDVMVRAILETAESLRAPVFLMCLSGDLEGNGWAYLPGLIKAVGDHHNVPVVLHLDHADRLELIGRALDAGFTSVMIDGSKLPFQENVRLTKAAVEMALEASFSAENVLTEPDEVARFVAETGVDSLAVSIGTSHGVYESLPTLSIERLRGLNQASPVPLVLHGGSGTPDDQIRDAVANGICKMNVFADCRMAMGRGLRTAFHSQRRDDPLPRDIFGPIKQEIARVVREKIELLSAAGRV